MKALRVGIDVGGTFTDVVAVEAETGRLVCALKVPTTHRHADGVAAGIVDALGKLFARPEIDPSSVAFIAHSTTQATNALLEGDVATVGLIGVASRNPLVRAQLRLPPIRLTAERVLQPEVRFIERRALGDAAAAIAALRARGAEAIAVSEAFGVDDPSAEATVVAVARELGVAATSGHDVASSYGLRARTRTAVVNAAILPTMIRTAQVTAGAVARAGIHLPLMIMRSDGGVMDVREVERRPILTMLSGPAAGVAGALLHENVSDGVFVEVGGTSADCSAIVRGRPRMRAARVGGHRMMVRTLDVRTVGVAGGSLVHLAEHPSADAFVREVGPRSAHIAGLRYACFCAAEELRGARGELGDDRLLALTLASGERVALTPTCAANALGLIPERAFARSDAASARLALELAARALGTGWERLARAVLERACAQVRAVVDELVAEHGLDPQGFELVGGGGGAAAIVPFLAERMGARWRLARDAEVISPIGVARALVREVVERTIPAPQTDDVVRVRREAIERVVAAGASRELVEATVEVDARRSLVRAIAQGATAAVGGQAELREVDDEERRDAAARVGGASETPRELARVGDFVLYETARTRRSGLRREHVASLVVVDRRGVVRSVAERAAWRTASLEQIEALLPALVDEHSRFGDGGRSLPDVTLVYGARCVELGTIAEVAHVVALAAEELRGLAPDLLVAIIAA